MSGLYFMAAGKRNSNRKTLDDGEHVRIVSCYLPEEGQTKLLRRFGNDELVYAWGASRRHLRGLDQLTLGDYVVDVDGPTVRQVFQFVFYLYLRDNRFQDWVGWDAEKSGNERRTYPFVYFLRNPQPVADRNKDFFQVAFGAKKSNFLISQKWFDEARVKAALAKADVPSIEAFLGI